ncbi:unnamed protein product [Microthlaspi erraticum]|uniref:NYN domain-containing protein n=1 Tax=Microthlaspi erraticum TaxID=1685480 RepID=A0A6D2JK58_9BRAS|nr:unnamed protein product [Microthlaspi erraticum]
MLDVDARRVGPFIRRALKSLGYNGDLTITAIGILSQVPIDVLRALSSTGISLHHVPTMYNKSIMTSVYMWKSDNPPPANVMLISLQRIFGQFIADLSEKYYVLGSKVPYDRQLEPTVFARRAGCFLWESLLASLRAGFESFTKHILSKEHALDELDYYPGGVEAGNESRARKEDAAAILARLQGLERPEDLKKKKKKPSTRNKDLKILIMMKNMTMKQKQSSVWAMEELRAKRDDCRQGSHERRKKVGKSLLQPSLISSYRYGEKVSSTLQEVEELLSKQFGDVCGQIQISKVEEKQVQQIIVGQKTMVDDAWKHLMKDGVGTMGCMVWAELGKQHFSSKSTISSLKKGVDSIL